MPLKHLNNFWIILDVPLINCEINLVLTWSKNCVLSDIITYAVVAARGDNPARQEFRAPTNAAFIITDIDPTSNKVNSLFVLSSENEDDRPSFSKYYTPKVEIKDFNVLIDDKSFFDVSIKNKEDVYEEIIEMSKNYDYNTGNLLDYEYFSRHHKLIAIDLSKEWN